jgi:single-stranded-DNA-specific exonuclease
VSGVNIVELIETVKELVGKYGGHKGAAGLTVSSQDFKKFTKELVKSANATISDEDLVKKINIDAEVGLSEMTFEILARLNEFEPFGMGNIKPVFASSHVLFDDFRFVGKNANHFSAIAKNNNTKIKSIYFNFPFDKSMIKYDENYSIAFTLSQDEWNGNKKLSLNILDIKEDNL